MYEIREVITAANPAERGRLLGTATQWSEAVTIRDAKIAAGTPAYIVRAH